MSWNPTATKLCKYQWDLIQHPKCWIDGSCGTGENALMKGKDCFDKDYAIEIKQILDQIKYAVHNNKNNIIINLPLNIKFIAPIMYSSQVIVNGKKYEMAITATNLKKNYNTNHYYVEINPTKYITIRSSKALCRTGKFKILRLNDLSGDNDKDQLDIVLNENDFNDIGKYIYQDKWNNNGFSPNDRDWVLYLFSPDLSEKFKLADGDLLEQRRITYWALTNTFVDGEGKPSSWSELEFKNNPYNYAARLFFNPNAKKEGLTVYFYEGISNGIQLCNIGRSYPANPPMYKIQEFEYKDIYYPVDIKLWDGNDKPALGHNYYNQFDFNGIYSEFSLFAGNFTKGSGYIIGRMKGFGVLEYSYEILNEDGLVYNIEGAITSGVIDGLYVFSYGIATPLNFQGISVSNSLSGGLFSMGEWSSYNLNNNINWEGENVGLTISKSFSKYFVFTKGKYKSKSVLVFPKLSYKTIQIFKKHPKYYGY